jgi:O-antigen ligase
VALDLIGLVPWVALFLFGGWLVVTGRRPISWLPEGIRPGWRLRLYGLVCCLLGAFFIYRISRGSFSPEGVFFSYLACGVGLLAAWRRAQNRASGRQA